MDLLLLTATVLLVSSITGNVHAYLDPGTGSMASQMMLAAVVGALATVKVFWTRIRSFFFKPEREKRSILD